MDSNKNIYTHPPVFLPHRYLADAAQERGGGVSTRSDQNLLPDEKKVSVSDIGLTHDPEGIPKLNTITGMVAATLADFVGPHDGAKKRIPEENSIAKVADTGTAYAQRPKPITAPNAHCGSLPHLRVQTSRRGQRALAAPGSAATALAGWPPVRRHPLAAVFRLRSQPTHQRPRQGRGGGEFREKKPRDRTRGMSHATRAFSTFQRSRDPQNPTFLVSEMPCEIPI